jgi:hypothetical protein
LAKEGNYGTAFAVKKAPVYSSAGSRSAGAVWALITPGHSAILNPK